MKYEAGSAKSIEESKIEWFVDRFIGIPTYTREVKIVTTWTRFVNRTTIEQSRNDLQII